MGNRKNRNTVSPVQAPQVEEAQEEAPQVTQEAQEAPSQVEEAQEAQEAQEVPGLGEEAQEEAQAPQEAQEAPEEAQEGEEAREARVEALRTRRMALLQELAQLDNQLATLQTHLLVTSQVEGPVALCRKVFVAMYGEKRSKVVNTLVGKGVAPNTAKTQYQVLRKKVLEGDTKLVGEIVEAGRPLE